MIEGKVLEADPPNKLVQTWHPIWDQEIAAEALTCLTWVIEQGQGDTTKLTVTYELDSAPRAAAQVADLSHGAGAWCGATSSAI